MLFSWKLKRAGQLRSLRKKNNNVNRVIQRRFIVVGTRRARALLWLLVRNMFSAVADESAAADRL